MLGSYAVHTLFMFLWGHFCRTLFRRRSHKQLLFIRRARASVIYGCVCGLQVHMFADLDTICNSFSVSGAAEIVQRNAFEVHPYAALLLHQWQIFASSPECASVACTGFVLLMLLIHDAAVPKERRRRTLISTLLHVKPACPRAMGSVQHHQRGNWHFAGCSATTRIDYPCWFYVGGCTLRKYWVGLGTTMNLCIGCAG